MTITRWLVGLASSPARGAAAAVNERLLVILRLDMPGLHITTLWQILGLHGSLDRAVELRDMFFQSLRPLPRADPSC